jgi:hypothetical protein
MISANLDFQKGDSVQAGYNLEVECAEWPGTERAE